MINNHLSNDLLLQSDNNVIYDSKGKEAAGTSNMEVDESNNDENVPKDIFDYYDKMDQEDGFDDLKKKQIILLEITPEKIEKLARN